MNTLAVKEPQAQITNNKEIEGKIVAALEAGKKQVKK